jgi:protocatechuate 3,4-dioxygenase beta subunit
MQTRRLRRALLFAGLAAAWSDVAAAQVAPATVAGAVVDGGGNPVADATVTLWAPSLPGGSRSLQTDDAGAFHFADLGAGRYRIGAMKPGFVPVQEGQRHYRANGRPFSLREGERRDVRLRLPRLGVITGRVVDQRGNPLVNAAVRALEISMSAGYRRILSKAEARTDDRGIYRLHSLWPDAYLVCASMYTIAPPPADRTGPARGYAPACHAAAAGTRSTIVIGPGDERDGVDVRLADVRLAHVEGTVTGYITSPDQRATLSLFNQDEALGDLAEGAQMVGGQFRFRHVPPGRYALVLTEHSASRNPSPLRWLAAAPLVVTDEDLTGVVLDVPRTATVRGEVVLHGGSAASAPLMSRVDVRLEPAEHGPLTRHAGQRGTPDASGRFELTATPGSYYLSVGARDQPPTWLIDALTLDGRDLLVEPIEL